MEELKKLLFSLSKATLKQTFDKFASKAPESLTSQFPNRASKPEAVKSYKERRKISTKLFPAGKIYPIVQCILIKFTQISSWSFISYLHFDTGYKIKKIEPVLFYFGKLTSSCNSLFAGEEQNVLQERMQQENATSQSKVSKTTQVSRKSKQPARGRSKGTKKHQ